MSIDYDELDDSYLIDEKIVSGYFENEESIEPLDSRDCFSNYEIEDHLDVYFRLFGSNDIDIIYLYYLSGKKQHEIKELLNKTQPAISYDVSRIKLQIDFVTHVVEKMDDFIIFIVDEENGLNIKERELLLIFFYSTSIVKTAKILGQNQITCRTRIRKAIEKLNKLGHKDMYNFFCYILDNLNKIKNVPIK